jgi:hypothetical protein
MDGRWHTVRAAQSGLRSFVARVGEEADPSLSSRTMQGRGRRLADRAIDRNMRHGLAARGVPARLMPSWMAAAKLLRDLRQRTEPRSLDRFTFVRPSLEFSSATIFMHRQSESRVTRCAIVLRERSLR